MRMTQAKKEECGRMQVFALIEQSIENKSDSVLPKTSPFLLLKRFSGPV